MHHPDTTNAAKQIGFKDLLVAHLGVSTVDAGREILKKTAGELLTPQAAEDLGDAARKVCGAVG